MLVQRPADMALFDALPREVRAALNYSVVKLSEIDAHADLMRYGSPAETVHTIQNADRAIRKQFPHVATQ